MNILEVTNLSKKFLINSVKKTSSKSLREEIVSFIKHPLLLSEETPKMGFWALKKINFNLKSGQTLGIIGRNGSGKSTLLKIIAGVTPPTTGEIKIYGKIASLLNYGIGFHPDLSGRENIFLSGAVLGYSREKILEEFDNIVSFAGIEKFIDTPIKHYSSGMYVRLAFSIATAPGLKPDIFLVDEILSAGDAQFQEKSFSRVKDLLEKDGVSVVFVSHNLALIEQICDNCLWLEEGRIKMFGNTAKVLESYRKGLKLT